MRFSGHNQRKEFTPVAKLKQVEISLNTLEFRLSNIQQLLHRPDRRRGILNLGGTVLKSIRNPDRRRPSRIT